jgi:S-adenosylmethionine:tRNA-ribosyltransferase-isomerase (queuine synthetase)
VQINTQPGIAAQDAAQQQYPFFGYGDGGLLFHHRGGHR